MPVESAGLDAILDNGLLISLGGLGGIRLGVYPHWLNSIRADLVLIRLQSNCGAALKLLAGLCTGTTERAQEADFEDLLFGFCFLASCQHKRNRDQDGHDDEYFGLFELHKEILLKRF